MQSLSGDFIDPLRCYISDYLLFFFPSDPHCTVAGGWGELHAPGLQIQQTGTKHYIILSGGGGGSSSMSRARTNQNLLSPLLNYASSALLTPGGAGGGIYSADSTAGARV